MMMTRWLAAIALTATLAGCGYVGVGIAGGTGAATKADEARQARETEARVKRELEAASQQAAQQQRAADAQ